MAETTLIKLSAYIPALLTAGCDIQFGQGTPGNVAPSGTLYVRTDGTAASGRLFINTSGSTTWAVVTSA